MWANIHRIVLEAGIYVSHIIWRIRYREVIKEAKRTGRTIDEILEPGGECSDTERGDDPMQSAEEPSESIDINDPKRSIDIVDGR